MLRDLEIILTVSPRAFKKSDFPKSFSQGYCKKGLKYDQIVYPKKIPGDSCPLVQSARLKNRVSQ